MWASKASTWGATPRLPPARRYHQCLPVLGLLFRMLWPAAQTFLRPPGWQLWLSHAAPPKRSTAARDAFMVQRGHHLRPPCRPRPAQRAGSEGQRRRAPVWLVSAGAGEAGAGVGASAECSARPHAPPRRYRLGSRVLLDVARALSYLHSKGVVHMVSACPAAQRRTHNSCVLARRERAQLGSVRVLGASHHAPIIPASPAARTSKLETCC